MPLQPARLAVPDMITAAAVSWQGSSCWLSRSRWDVCAGHCYYFLEDVYPRQSGRRPLKTPQLLKMLFPRADEIRPLAQPAGAEQAGQGGVGQNQGPQPGVRSKGFHDVSACKHVQESPSMLC